MVDMSATLIHHGHVRLLKKASSLGSVIVALTTDDSILEFKGYVPELSFEYRKEILLSIRYVDEVVPSPWLLTEEFVESHNVDFLVHGDDNSNLVKSDKMIIFPRTDSISSTELRHRVVDALTSQEKFVRADLN